jgi:hypothetical protein
MSESLSDLERGEIRGRPTTAQDALNSTGFTCHRLHQSFNSRLCTMLLSMPRKTDTMKRVVVQQYLRHQVVVGVYIMRECRVRPSALFVSC